MSKMCLTVKMKKMCQKCAKRVFKSTWEGFQGRLRFTKISKNDKTLDSEISNKKKLPPVYFLVLLYKILAQSDSKCKNFY